MRIKEKVSQAVMTKILNVAPSTYQKWERGEVHPKGGNLKLLRLARSRLNSQCATKKVYLMDRTNNDPLHGITLEVILNSLLACYGWEGLAERVKINCFSSNPSIKSSLKFLRKTPWARTKIETLYLASLKSKDCDNS